MQLTCKCKYCGHIHLSDKDDDLAVEIDAMEEAIRFVCRNPDCRKNNTISFAERKKLAPLPKSMVGRG
jgi:hypothetical protein